MVSKTKFKKKALSFGSRNKKCVKKLSRIQSIFIPPYLAAKSVYGVEGVGMFPTAKIASSIIH